MDFEIVDGAEVAQAWNDLRAHPALVWVPPVWRTADTAQLPMTALLRYGVSAVDRNLVIEICTSVNGIEVRLATGPLTDRPLSNGAVDPTTPAATLDPSLSTTAPSFERAVVQLRDAVVQRYGGLGAVS